MISLCMIVKNGQEHIAKCLESIKDLVGEMIIIDTGSTDQTKNIALKFNAKVFDYEWDFNLSNARNSSIEKAKGDWILVLDHDEIISKNDLNIIKNLIQNNEYLAYYLIQRDYTNEIGTIGWTSCKDDKYEESKIAYGYVPIRVVRLFQNKKEIRFEDPAHPSVKSSIRKINGKIGESEVVIHHLGFLKKDPKKVQLYIDIAKKNRLNNYYQEYQIGSQLRNIGKFKEALEHLTESLKLKPDFYLTLLELGILFIQLGKIKESKRFFEETLKIKEHEMAWNHLGIVMAYENNTQEAIKCFRKAIFLNPKNADFHYNLSQALKKNGNIKEAQAELENAKELNPTYKNS